MTPAATPLTLRVAEARSLNPLIKMIRLRAEDGSTLPGFEAGAHVRVQVALPDGQTDWRHYSLIDPAARRQRRARRILHRGAARIRWPWRLALHA